MNDDPDTLLDAYILRQRTSNAIQRSLVMENEICLLLPIWRERQNSIVGTKITSQGWSSGLRTTTQLTRNSKLYGCKGKIPLLMTGAADTMRGAYQLTTIPLLNKLAAVAVLTRMFTRLDFLGVWSRPSHDFAFAGDLTGCCRLK